MNILPPANVAVDQSDQGFTPASTPSATAITRKLPSEILPGFSLKSRSGTNETSSVGQVPSTFFVYVEKLDVEVDIFDGKSLSLIVEYVGGDTDVQEPVDIDELDDDFDWAAEAIKDVENPLDVIFKVYEEDKANQVEGYYCFKVEAGTDWVSGKVLQTMKFMASVHDDFPTDESTEERTDISGHIVGSPYILSKSMFQSLARDNLLYLDWNTEASLMREVFAPDAMEALRREKSLSQDILFLAMEQNKNFNPNKDISIHVNLFGYDGAAGTLKFRMYNGVEISPVMTKSLNDSIEDALNAVSSSTSGLTAFGSRKGELVEISDTVINRSSAGWINVSFSTLDLLSAILNISSEVPKSAMILDGISKRELNDMITKRTGSKFFEEDDKISIKNALRTSRFAVHIEGVSSGGSATCLAKCFIDGVKNNDLYFDSAVQLLRNPLNMRKDKIMEWSCNAFYSAVTDFHITHRYAPYKLTHSSVPTNDPQGKQSFELFLELPLPSTDPTKVCLLVQHCDAGMHFSTEDSDHKFKLLNCSEVNTSSKEFKFTWEALPDTFNESNVKVKVMVVSKEKIHGANNLELEKNGMTGRPSSFSVNTVRGMKHSISMRLRRAKKLGITSNSFVPDADESLEVSFVTFLESTFTMLYASAAMSNERRTVLQDAAENVADAFVKNAQVKNVLTKLKAPLQDEVFNLSLDANVDFVDVAYAFQWILSILLEEKSLNTSELLSQAFNDESHNDIVLDVLSAELLKANQWSCFELAEIISKQVKENQMDVDNFLSTGQVIKKLLDITQSPVEQNQVPPPKQVTQLLLGQKLRSDLWFGAAKVEILAEQQVEIVVAHAETNNVKTSWLLTGKSNIESFLFGSEVPITKKTGSDLKQYTIKAKDRFQYIIKDASSVEFFHVHQEGWISVHNGDQFQSSLWDDIALVSERSETRFAISGSVGENVGVLECVSEENVKKFLSGETVLATFDVLDKDGNGSSPTQYKMTAIDDKTIQLTQDDENMDVDILIIINKFLDTTNDDDNLGSEVQISLDKLQEEDMESLLSQAETLSKETDALPSLKLSSSNEKVPQALLATMENNLLSLLETTDSGGDKTISLLEASQELMVSLLSPIDTFNSLEESFNNLYDKASSLTSIVNVVTKLVLKLGRSCPFAPVKVFCLFVKTPVNILINALKTGRDTIKRLRDNVVKRFKEKMNKIKGKIDNISGKIDEPIEAVEKFREFISMLIGLARSNLLPLHLVRSFASIDTLKGFFETLNSKFEPMEVIMQGLSSAVNNITPFVGRVNSLLSSIDDKVNLVSPLDSLFRNLEYYADEAERIVRKYSPWWLRYLLDGAMWLIEQAVNLIINPVKPRIAETLEKLNPLNAMNFGSFETIMNSVPDFTTIQAKLNVVENLQDSFKKIEPPITFCVAMIQSGFYRILDGLLEVGVNNLKVIEDLMGGRHSDGFRLLQKELADMNHQMSNDVDDTNDIIPENNFGDLILTMKKESIEGSIAKFDSYLLMNTSNDLFTDEFTSNLPLQENHELIHCDPTHDEKSGLFEYSRYSWVMASMAVLLHYDKITEQAESLKMLPSEKRVIASFLPENRGSGKYNVLLHPRLGTTRNIIVDSRLPVGKEEFKFNSIEELATDVLNYANDKILADVDEAFPDKIGLALVEKVLSCVLNVPVKESVGTAMHLLSGNSSGCCYKKNVVTTKEWAKYPADKTQHQSPHFDSIVLQSFSETLTESAVIDLVKSRTMSREDVELLDSLVRPGGKRMDSHDRSIIKEAIEGLSMFVVVMENGDAHPVLYTDNTLESNIVYGDGPIIQPLGNLSSISEIWEYSVTERPPPAEPPTEPPVVKPPITEPPATKPPIYSGSLRKGDKFVTRYFKRFGNGYEFDNITMTVRETSPILISYTNMRNMSLSVRHSELNAINQLSSGSSVDGFNFVMSRSLSRPVIRKHKLRFVDTNTIEIVNDGATLVRVNNPRTLLSDTETGMELGQSDNTQQMQDDILFSDRNLNPQSLGDILSQLLRFLSITIRNQNHRAIIQRAVQGCGTFKKKKNNRVVKIGDYVKNRRFPSRSVSTVVKKFERNVKKPNSRFVKKITHYLVRHLNSTRTEKWAVKETKKLTDKEKNNATIFKHYLSLKRNRMASRASSELSPVQKKYLQWAGSTDRTKANVEKWGLTFSDLKETVNFHKEEVGEIWDKAKKHEGQYVSIEAYVKECVYPATKDGYGIGLMLHNAEKPAEVFVSVSWEDSIEQMVDLLESMVGKQYGPEGDKKTFRYETVLWIAPFSLYHGPGTPTLQQQLGIPVFEVALNSTSVTEMILIQTKNCDPHSRLWCNSELYAAIKRNDDESSTDINIRYLFSDDWKETYIKEKTSTGEYEWREYNGKKVYIKKGLTSEDKVLVTGSELFRRPNAVQYVLTDEEEWGGLEDPDDSTKIGSIQPILRLNVLEGLGTFPTAVNEMKRLDDIGEDPNQFWWDLQGQIVQRQLDAAGVKETYEGSTTLVKIFERTIGRQFGSNSDAMEKAKNVSVKTLAINILGYDPYERRVKYTNAEKKEIEFLFMDRDSHATTYFTRCMNLKPRKFNDDERYGFILSFGARDVNFGFKEIMKLADALESTYVDSMKLPQLAGSYMSSDGEHPRNIFWMFYYKFVMSKTETTMAFVITPAWRDSHNCWQEMAWAYNLRHGGGKVNIIVFQDEAIGNSLKVDWYKHKPLKDIFVGYRKYLSNLSPEEREQEEEYTWNGIMDRLGVREEDYIFATTLADIKKEIKSKVGDTRGMIMQLF